MYLVIIAKVAARLFTIILFPVPPRLFVDPDDVIWNQGSVLIMVGTVRIDEETQEVNWDLYIVLPFVGLAEPRMIKIKPVSGEKETVDINAPAPEENPL